VSHIENVYSSKSSRLTVFSKYEATSVDTCPFEKSSFTYLKEREVLPTLPLVKIFYFHPA